MDIKWRKSEEPTIDEKIGTALAFLGLVGLPVLGIFAFYMWKRKQGE